MASNKGYVDTQIAAIPAVTDQTPAGTVIYSARSTAPTGYVKANGAAISRSTFSVLFSAIGTIYGAGNGSTTFNVPDLRGEFIRGLSDGSTVDSGRALGSNQADQNKQHNHGVSDPGHFHLTESNNGTGGNYSGGGNSTNLGAYYAKNTGAKTTGISISNDGGTEARPRNVALLACIKT